MGILTSSLILLTIIRTITNLLLVNTCICTLELCISYILIYGLILKNDLSTYPNVTVSNRLNYDQEYLCPLHSYFLFCGFSLPYTSYCLQAYHRLRQVIFYKQPVSNRSFCIMIILQWTFSIILILSMYLTGAFQYLPNEFFCPIPFRPQSVAYIAITMSISMYLWIYQYANRTTLITLQHVDVQSTGT